MPPVLTEQQKNLFQAAGLTPAQQAAVLAQVPYVSTGQLTTQTPVTPVNVTPTPTVQPPSITNLPVTPPAPVTPPKPDYIKSLESLTTNLIGQPEETTKRIETEASPFQRQLNEIDKQLKMQQANALERQKKALESGETLEFATGTARQAAFTDAIETLRLAAVKEGLQGDIAMAKTHAENAVNAEFAQKKKDLEVARQNILDNYASFTTEQKKRADVALKRLDKDDAFVNQQIEDRKTVQGVALQAGQNGASTAVIQNILKSSDLVGALSAATGYLDKQTESSIQRYNFAKQQNYTGSYTDFLNYEESIKAKNKVSAEGNADADDIADGIINGTLPPDLTKTVSFRNRTAVTAALQRRGYNLTKATKDWIEITKHLSAQNSQQQLNYRQAVEVAYESLDLVSSLNDEVSKFLVRKGINVVNKAQIELAKNGVYGDEARSAATRFDNQIADLLPELAKVYTQGYASTDDQLRNAGKQLSSDWTQKVLHDNIDLIKQNLQIRKNSIANVGVASGSTNIYAAPQSLEQRAKNGGYDYQKMKNIGYTDEQIESALKQKGL